MMVWMKTVASQKDSVQSCFVLCHRLVVDLSTKHWTKEAINEHEALMKTIPQYEVLNDIYVSMKTKYYYGMLQSWSLSSFVGNFKVF